MAEVYRFRSTARLLGCKELEDQYLYFSKPDELNDPAEGLRDVVWQGDAIVWTNLFKHYLYCVQLFYGRIQFTLDDRRLGPDDIQVSGLSALPLTTKGTCPASDRFCNTVFERARIDDLVTSIGDRTVRYDELLMYLQTVHATCLTVLQEIYGGHPTTTGSGSNTRITWNALGKEMQHIDAHYANDLLRIGNELTEDLKLRERLMRTAPSSVFELNYNVLHYDLPRHFMRKIETLLYPEWYVACFSKDFRNSSSWAHYGDAHRGACLIFATESIQGGDSLGIRQITGYSFSKTNSQEHWGSVPMLFHDIQYGDSPGDIDFFRSMGALPWPELESIWYTDESGRLSDCSAGLNEETWRTQYWSRFLPDIIKKTKDWKHEQETRLVMHSMLDDLDEERKRVCGYEFDSLKGIIFWIRTPEHEKMKIMRILLKESREHSRTDLDIYQAYYRSAQGDIDRRRIRF